MQTALENRIIKNYRKLKSWAARIPTQAWRLYDHDIPEYPLFIDVYGDHFLIYERAHSVLDAGKDLIGWAQNILTTKLAADANRIVVKKRERQFGLEQYERLDSTGRSFAIQEGPAQFLVNLWDYLDTGLFLDHRPMRHRVYKEAAKSTSVLNLFCYTGSVSTVAALGGAIVDSVDMSSTYLEWAQNNFRLNKLTDSRHQFIREDALKYLEQASSEAKYDLIFLDPPTFSNSKKMSQHFEVEQDQEFLVHSCIKRLKINGVLYFSNNKRDFKLSKILESKYLIKNITTETIPPDFHDQKIHHCYEIRCGPPKG